LKDKIRKHMQSITLMALAGFLLVIAFYVSQQTQTGERKPSITVTPHESHNSVREIPNCSEDLPIHEALICYNEASQISEALVSLVEDKLVQLESDPARRVVLIESQIAWEEARNTECNLVGKMNGGGNEGLLQELICRTELNLAHLKRLEHYHEDWYAEGEIKNMVEVDN